MSAKIMAFMRQINEGKVETNRAKIFVAIQRWNCVSTKTLIDNFGLHPTVTSVLSSLESDGLIAKEPLKGYTATNLLSMEEFNDLFQFRSTR